MDLFTDFFQTYCCFFLPATLIIPLLLGYFSAPLWLWTGFILLFAFGWGASFQFIFILFFLACLLNIKPIRRLVLSNFILKLFKKFQLVPRISETERVALEAGVVWIESDFFSGKPNFKKIMEEPFPHLSNEEQKTIDEKIDRLCHLVDDWDLWETREIDPKALEILKKEKFFGMIIPKKYGGLEFSALAHSEVIAKVSSRSIGLGVFIMVPNSLGPAELLHKYGTEEQKKKYLPKLASGEEIPCFALTEPLAGSDAGSIQSQGEIFKSQEGKLFIRLNWNKRWITLADISTLLGVAFRLKDPQNFLNKGEDLGITCALIPTNTKGVIVGKRHDPLGVPFHNCPTQGHNVEVPLEEVIVGGIEGCGRGWMMLMDCLTAGRGISLPAQSAGSGKLASLAVSAHAVNRKQFGLSVGRFEGVEEAIAQIVGCNYIMESCRIFTAGSIDNGIKSPVITAIAKHYCTEMMRTVVNRAMDVLGGAGISRGPRNIMAHPYISAPIAITVEGANIMTRTLIIFGQGVLRAHPYAYKEVIALEKNDLPFFDTAFWGHIGHIVNNLCRTIVLGLTRGFMVFTPKSRGRRIYQKLTWTSAVFALMTDIAMGSLGGGLKTKGKITGRYADILAWMYLLTCVLRRYKAEGEKKEDWPIIEYVSNHAFNKIQSSFEGIFENLKVPGLTWFFRGPVNWWTRLNSLSSPPSDKISHKLARLIQQDTEQRDRLTRGIYVSDHPEDGLNRINQAFKTVKKAENIERKIRKAIRSKVLPKKRVMYLMDLALEKSVITKEEYELINKAEEMRRDAIQVDSFTQEEYSGHKARSSCLS